MWPLREALSSAQVQGGMELRWEWLLMVVVVDGGGCGKKEVTWQHFSHSYHIWDTTGREGGIYFPMVVYLTKLVWSSWL